MKKKSIWLLVCFFTVFCSPNFEEADLLEKEFNIINNKKDLNTRVLYYNQPLLINNGTAKISTVNDSNSIESIDLSSIEELNHTWYFVAEVNPPTINGANLSATYVQVIDDLAFVTYNKQGNQYAGGLEIYDLSNKAYPSIISQVLFEDADVNAIGVDFKGNRNFRQIWLALSHKKHGAMVRKMDIVDGLISENVADIKLSDYSNTGISASANGIVRVDQNLYVTSGKSHGGLYSFEVDDFEFVNFESYTNAKYVTANGTNPNSTIVSLVTGDSAAIHIQKYNSGNSTERLEIGSVMHQNVVGTYRGKSVLHFTEKYEDVVFVATGMQGLKGFDIISNEQKFHTNNDLLTTGNTNGVSSDDDYIYMANGADGLAVALMPEVYGEIEPIFTWDLNEKEASANYLTTDGEWIFIAKGKKGLKILRKKDDGEHQTIHGVGPYGVPIGLEPDNAEVCTDLLPNLYNNVLPEQSNVLDRNPEFFENNVREIELLKTDKVYVTFITERAGYKNTLGYYYYHKDNPPSSTDDLSKVVIFPNASKEHDGGKLIEGNTMKLLGTFEEGTIIGFYLISAGWNGRKITNGIYTQYTIPRFNVSRAQQSIMFYDQTCSSLVMTFEDIALPKGDKDFNDVIFMITAEDSTSIDTGIFIQQ